MLYLLREQNKKKYHPNLYLYDVYVLYHMIRRV